MSPPFTQWHHVELIHPDLLRILHWAETDMDEEVTETINVRVSSRHDQEHQGARLAKCNADEDMTGLIKLDES